VLLAGCATEAAVSPTVTVTVTNTGCSPSSSSAESGEVPFTVTNASDEVAAVEIRAGDATVGGISNIAPGISRDLVLALGAGDYELACTPGPTAEPITAAFTVTGATLAPRVSTAGASESYQAWVRGRTAELREATVDLIAAFDAGNPGAQQRYREARTLWASLRPVVQKFPELLPAIDARQSDLVAGERLSGWHALEKDLWPPSDYEPLSPDARAELSAELLADLDDLLARVDTVSLAPEEIAAGAQALIDAASRAVSDGDERWSHAELSLVQGDLDGATAAIDALRDSIGDQLAVIEERSAKLQSAIDEGATARELVTRIDALATALATIELGDARIEP
jgi:iron uptake system component EfeO